MEARDGQQMRQSRATKQIVGGLAHIPAITDQQRRRDAACRRCHAARNLVGACLPEGGKTCRPATMRRIVPGDSAPACNIAACHHITGTGAKRVIRRTMQHPFGRRIDARHHPRHLAGPWHHLVRTN